MAGVNDGPATQLARSATSWDAHFRDRATHDPKIGWMLGALHVAPSIIALSIAAVALSEGAASAGAVIGIGGLLVDAFVGALYFVLYRGPAHAGSDRAQCRLADLRRAIDAIPPSTRSDIYTDVQHALMVLYERGLISEEEWTRAHDLPIGLLALGMAPATDSASSGAS